MTLAELKIHARVDNTAEDALLAAMITAARQQVEAMSGRALVEQSYEYHLPCAPVDYIELPCPPLQSVTSVTYVDTAGATQTWSSSLYTVDKSGAYGRIYPVYGGSWPTMRHHYKALTVTFVAGYYPALSPSSAQPQLPEAARLAVMMAAGDMYAHRESTITGTIVAENKVLQRLVDQFRLVRV